MDTHKNVSFEVRVGEGEDRRSFKSFAKACHYAVSASVSGSSHVYVDVLCHTRGGAVAFGLEQEYDADPEASVTCRVEVSTNYIGLVA